MTDFTFMEENGKLFLNAPNAIAGNEVSKCDTSSAKFQSEESGLLMELEQRRRSLDRFVL